MTKTYNLVTLYYKGRAPIKKEDNSYFMCLYTMLFVLFAMVIILLLCTLFNLEKTSETPVIVNKPQSSKNITASTTTTTPSVNQRYYYEETAPPIVNWDHVVDFFVGSEENKEDKFKPTEDTTLKSNKQNRTTKDISQHKDFSNATNSSEVPLQTSKMNLTTEKNEHQEFKTENSKVTEDNFNEWPEVTIEEVTSNKEEVEWVQTSQNSTIKDKTAQIKTLKDCRSAKCKIAASTMLSSVDLSVDPCKAFYSFACGRSSIVEKIDPGILDEAPDLDFVQNYRLFQQSCMDYGIHLNYRDRLKETKLVLGEIEWFNLGSDEINVDLTDVFGTLVLLDAMPFFQFDIDVMNSTFVLKMLPPDRSLSSKYWSPLAETRRNCLRTTKPEGYQSTLDITFLYYDYEKCQKNYNDYMKSVETALEELGTGNLTGIQNTLRQDLLPIFDEMDSVQDVQQKITNLEYVELNLKDLNKQFPIIDWIKLFQNININVTIAKPIIQMYNKEYFENLSKKISLLHKDELTKAFSAILAEKYYQELVLPTPKHSRAKYCSNLSRKLFPDVSNYLQQKAQLDKDFKQRKNYIHDIFQNLKHDFQNFLINSDWLDDFSRNSMINKLNNLKLETSSMDLKDEIVYLRKLYLKLFLKRDFSFNYNQVTKFRRQTFFNLHGKEASTDNIFRNFVNNLGEEPKFFYGHNIVCIPDGLVHKTFTELPHYLTMAKIGFPLARVIGRTFDPLGVKFNLNLSADVSSLYDKFVRESRRTLPHHLDFKKNNVVFNLNARISEAARIAENTAMSLMTNSMEEIQNQALLPLVSFTFSREKVFFMALVQEICQDTSLMEFTVKAHENSVLPAQFQIQNILQNSEAFNTQFSCRPVVKFPLLQFPHLSVLISKETDKIT